MILATGDMLGWEQPPRHYIPPQAMDVYHELCPPSNSRQMRNRAEKQRRDKLNSHISELAQLVPMVAQSPKRMDKTSILRLSATFLRMYRCLPLKPGEMHEPFLPFMESLTVSQVLLDFLQDMEGFMLVVTGAGKIVFVTHTVEKLLGHTQNDLLGQSLYSITRPEDHDELRRNIETGDSRVSASSSPTALPSDESSSEDPVGNSTPTSSPSSSSRTTDCGGGGGTDHLRRSFYIHLSQRAGGRSSSEHGGSYELVHVLGYLQVPRAPEQLPTTSHRGRRHREAVPSSNSDNVLVAVVQLFREKKIAELSLLEATLDEYQTRHYKDGRIVYSDHRISVVAGYLADEVQGLCAFSFMHQEDMPFAAVALRQMFEKGEKYGSSTYRLMSKTGEYIYMKTRGYLEFVEGTNVADYFICMNTLVSKEEGEAGIKEMKQRFSALVAAMHAGTSSPPVVAASTSTTALPSTESVASLCEVPLKSEDATSSQQIASVISDYGSSISPTGTDNTDFVNQASEIVAPSASPVVEHYVPETRSRAVSEGDDSTPFSLQNFMNLFRVPEEHENLATDIPSRQDVTGRQSVDDQESPRFVTSELVFTATLQRARAVSEGEVPSSVTSSRTDSEGRGSVWNNQGWVPKNGPPERPTVITGRCCAGSPESRVRCSRLERREEGFTMTAVRGEVTVLKRTMTADADDSSTSKKLNVGPRCFRQRQRSGEIPPTEALSVEVPSLHSDELQRLIVGRDTQPSVLVSSQHSVLRTAPPAHVESSGLPLLNLDPLDRGDTDSLSSLVLPDSESGPEVLELLDGTDLKLGLDTLQEVRSSSSNTEEPETTTVAPEAAVTLERILAHKHLQLESRMQLQETQIHCIEHDLTQIPLADTVFRSDLAHLQVESILSKVSPANPQIERKAQHKKHQILLSTLKQDRQKIHCNKMKVCNVKQDVGV